MCCKRFLKQNNGRVSRKWSHGRVMKCFIKKHLFLIKCRSGAGSVMVCLKTCCSENSSFCGWVVTGFSEFSLQSQRMFSSWWLQPHPLFSHHRGHISLITIVHSFISAVTLVLVSRVHSENAAIKLKLDKYLGYRIQIYAWNHHTLNSMIKDSDSHKQPSRFPAS